MTRSVAQPSVSVSPSSRDDYEAVDILVANIIKAIKATSQNTVCDRTFKSVVRAIASDGYVIIDEAGTSRTVKCAIPNADLKVGLSVWVKIPCGNINQMHICGIN